MRGLREPLAVDALEPRLPPDTVVRIEAVDLPRTWVVPAEAGQDGAVVVRASSRRLLAWLLSRVTDASLPTLAPWHGMRPAGDGGR